MRPADLLEHEQQELCEWAQREGLDPDSIAREGFTVSPSGDHYVAEGFTFDLDGDGRKVPTTGGVAMTPFRADVKTPPPHLALGFTLA